MDSVSTKKIITVVVILAVLCAYTWSLRLRTVPQPEPPDLESIPRALGGFTARDEYISPKSLRVLGADQTLARSYVDRGGNSIDLFIGYFADQQENSQIHSPKHCYPGAGWDILSEGSIALDIGGSDSAAPEADHIRRRQQAARYLLVQHAGHDNTERVRSEMAPDDRRAAGPAPGSLVHKILGPDSGWRG